MAGFDPIPVVSLSTDDIPQAHQFEVWKHAAEPLFDVVPMQDVQSFSCSATSYLVEQLVFSHTMFDQMQFIRTSKHLAGAESDYITLQYYCSGQIQGSLDNGTPLQMESDRISIHDFAHAYTGIGTTTNQFSIILPRHAIAVHDQIYQNDPMFSWSVDSPVGRLLSHSWETIWQSLPTLSQSDSPAIAQGFIGLLNGILSNKWDQTIRVQVEQATFDAMKTYLRHHLKLSNLGVDHLCEAFHCSRSTVYRLFKDVGGVRTYIREQRLIKCYQELNQLPPSSRKTIAEIAQQWGFSNAASFSRLFRQRYSISPSDVSADLHQPSAIEVEPTANYWSESDRLRIWLENID